MLFLILHVFLVLVAMVSGWDPDAGLVKSYTKMDHVTVSVTSGTTPNQVIDGDFNTNWVSGFCLPSGYLGRQDVNVMMGTCSSGQCTSSSNPQTDLADLTDGDVYTLSHVRSNGTMAVLSITMVTPQPLPVISVNGIYHDTTTFIAFDQQMNRHVLKVLTSSDNYKTINILDSNITVSKLELTSSSDFSVKEVAAMGPNGCTEQVTVDLGAVKSVGTIRSRHWAGSGASKLVLRTSVDGLTWKDVSDLDPSALRPVTTTVSPENIRYIALKYTVKLNNYKHIYCYEIDAWDEHGVYGSRIDPIPQTKSFRELLGVNGIWGWGTGKDITTLTNNTTEGPLLYSQIASHARNYHNMGWDITDPDLDPEFDQMALGHGTQAKWWLNWDKEYQAWVNANMSVDISLQFLNKSQPQYIWNNPEGSAFHYGQEIAKHFGSVHGNGLVKAVEVGNEPWDYDASFYATVLRNMSSGLKGTDSLLTVLPGAFQADDKDDEGNYIGTHVLQDTASNIDVLNCHTYSFINDNAGIRRGTYPENKLSTFNNVRPLTRWRDTNMPQTPIWVTEWGWDGSGEGEGCSGTECVSQKAQAVYAIRGLMLLARANVERATWYFYANLDCDTLFCRSGLTTSANTHFHKKAVFNALEALLQHIGDTRFIGIVQENDDGFVFALGGQSQSTTDVLKQASHLVAWLPVDINSTLSRNVVLDLPAGVTVNNGIRFTGDTGTLSTRPLTTNDMIQGGHTLTLTLTTEPIIVDLVYNGAPSIIG